MQNLRKNITDILKTGVDTILPPRCVITGDSVDEQGMISPKAWSRLNFITDPKCDCCGFPFEFEVEKGSFCTSCMAHPPPYDHARAALKYDDQSRDLILRFKHADQTHVVKAFMPWLKMAGERMLSGADLIVPVPLHYWRLLRRRYNQAALISLALSVYCDVPCLPQGLIRVRSTPSQGHLKAKERFKNVRRAFAVPDRYKDQIAGKKIVLIDDVFTTGATVNECTKALMKAGAEKVSVLTLSRVVRPGMD